MQTQDDATLETKAADSPSRTERRRSRRFPCNGFAEVILFQAGMLFRGEIRDISQTGCFVATKARVHMDSCGKVELRFTLNNNRFHTFARVANVRQGTGVGLEFAPLNVDIGTKLLGRVATFDQ
jgi:hypothetical protein